MSTFFSQRDHTCWPLAQSAYRCATVHEYLRKKTKMRPYLKSLKNIIALREMGTFSFMDESIPLRKRKLKLVMLFVINRANCF